MVKRLADFDGIYGCIACPERFDSPNELRGHLLYIHRHELAALGIPH